MKNKERIWSVILIAICLLVIIFQDYSYYPKPKNINVYCIQYPKLYTIEETKVKYTVTAYCSCVKCCGKWALNRPKDNQGKDIVRGANGKRLIHNYSVASSLPFGTKFYIDGKEYKCQDRTADFIAERYNGKIIDIYMDNHQDAFNCGKNVKTVTFKRVVFNKNLYFKLRKGEIWTDI